MIGSGYRLFRGEASEGLRAAIAANEKARLAPAAAEHKADDAKHGKAFDQDRLWKGWVLPASDADVWFVAGSAMYYHDLKSDDLELQIEGRRAAYRLCKSRPVRRSVIGWKRRRACYFWMRCAGVWATTPS